MMAKGQARSRWEHTSHVMCLVANVNRDPKKKSSPYKPSDFNPHTEPVETNAAVPKLKMKDLKSMIPAFAELAGQPRKRAAKLTERIHGR